MKLKRGYELVRTYSDGQYCGDGGRSTIGAIAIVSPKSKPCATTKAIEGCERRKPSSFLIGR